MNNPIEKPLPVIDLEKGDLIVDVDALSTGLWRHDHLQVCNTHYGNFDLPEWLVERFKYWTGWYNMYGPYDERPDKILFRAYGRSLAVDLKRFVGKEQRVFYGFHADNERKCQVSTEEIVLPDEEKVRAAIPT